MASFSLAISGLTRFGFLLRPCLKKLNWLHFLSWIEKRAVRVSLQGSLNPGSHFRKWKATDVTSSAQPANSAGNWQTEERNSPSFHLKLKKSMEMKSEYVMRLMCVRLTNLNLGVCNYQGWREKVEQSRCDCDENSCVCVSVCVCACVRVLIVSVYNNRCNVCECVLTWEFTKCLFIYKIEYAGVCMFIFRKSIST